MSSALESKPAEPLTAFSESLQRVNAYLEHVTRLNELYRAGNIHAHVPAALHRAPCRDAGRAATAPGLVG